MYVVGVRCRSYWYLITYVSLQQFKWHIVHKFVDSGSIWNIYIHSEHDVILNHFELDSILHLLSLIALFPLLLFSFVISVVATVAAAAFIHSQRNGPKKFECFFFHPNFNMSDKIERFLYYIPSLNVTVVVCNSKKKIVGNRMQIFIRKI